MVKIFNDPLHEQLGTWPLAYIPYGGPNFGEIVRLADEIGEGDDGVFHAVWSRAAGRLSNEADTARAAGKHVGARALYLKAASLFRTSYHPLFGKPVDARLVTSHRDQMTAFKSALELGPDTCAFLQVPFENGFLPACFIPAVGRGQETRPLLLLTNGYDGSITDLYFASAVAATRRGYHCLMFDGPGQGQMLIEQGTHLRADWETVVNAVVDVALTLPCVDADRIALSGWSLGGYLAPRAATGEHRLAACIADPGQAEIARGFSEYAIKLGATPTAASRLSELDQSFLDRLMHIVLSDRRMRWSVVQRGFWVNGTDDLRSYLRSIESFTLRGRVEQIRCPMLLTMAENDALAVGTQALYDQLRCKKALLRFTAAEGAGDHCEMGNRSILNDRVLDWLDDVMK